MIKLKSNFLRLFLILLVPVIFLISLLLTLSDYGINWDSPKHFIRGQAYLHYILTGNKNFLDYPTLPNPKGAPDSVDFNVEGATNSSIIKQRVVEDFKGPRSYFQSDFYTFYYFMTKHVHTHPEVNDLMIALTNFIFYQKLGLLGDIEAHHLFVVLVTFALISAIAFWVYRNWGIQASIVSTISLTLYPLVFAESHFNIKDPVLMSFFGLAILFFSYGFSKRKLLYILISALFAGFALGTKFNAFFLPFIFGPWIFFNIIVKSRKEKDKFNLLNSLGGWKMILVFCIYPIVALTILYVFSPYLWADPVGHFMEIVNYYKGIGREPLPPEMSRFLMVGWNTYPLVWVFITTPLPILFLSLLGISRSILKLDSITFLVLLWLAVPILRVMWPGANIYGGTRQIMEFVPALAIFSGIGAKYLKDNLRLTVVGQLSIFVVITLFLIIYEIVNIHPNQNVYFNQLIGGLRGARDRGIPSWGNSYGNVYLQGINWLNKNVETDAKLALAVNYIVSIPRLKLRPDIDLNNGHFSGTDRKGEYAMEMSYDWPLESKYKYAYYETFLYPVYEVLVDGVPLLKIWKNDLNHTKPGYEREIVIEPSFVGVEQQKMKISFEKPILLTRLIVSYFNEGCWGRIEDGFIAVSQDGENFVREPSPIYDPESPEASPGMDEDTFVYMFPARLARSITFSPQQSKSCILENYKVTVMGLAKSPE